MKPGIALITGCSTGIGRELALQLVARGWTVYAGARRPEALSDIAGERLIPLELDVNDGAHIKGCLQRLESDCGRLDMLVNNAGYGAMGPIVEMPLEQMRRQFETNVYAPLVMAQTLLPLLERSDAALIVNIGSVSGILTTPFSGAYCASKAALHSISDALRMELAPFGIGVLTVQPGGIRSEFGNNAERSLAETLPADSRYNALRRYIEARARASQKNGTPTSEFVAQLVRALENPNRPAEVRIGNGSTTLPLMKRLLPLRRVDRILAKRFGLLAKESAAESAKA